jgi:hypothetical protein
MAMYYCLSQELEHKGAYYCNWNDTKSGACDQPFIRGSYLSTIKVVGEFTCNTGNKLTIVESPGPIQR